MAGSDAGIPECTKEEGEPEPREARCQETPPVVEKYREKLLTAPSSTDNRRADPRAGQRVEKPQNHPIVRIEQTLTSLEK